MGVLPKLEEIEAMHASFEYSNRSGDQVKVRAFSVPRGSWHEVMTLLSESDVVDLTADIEFEGRLVITPHRGGPVEVWLLRMFDRMYYGVKTKNGGVEYYVSQRKNDNRLLLLLEELYEESTN